MPYRSYNPPYISSLEYIDKIKSIIMPTKKYPLKIRLLKDMYPYIKGSELTLNDDKGAFLVGNELIPCAGYYMLKVKVIGLNESENTNWFEPVIQEEAPPEIFLNFLEDGINQLKGSGMWHSVKERMNKMINDDKKT